jgi:adenosine deaminase
VRPATVVALARRNGSGAFLDAASFARRRRFGGPGDFLALYRDVCRELRRPGDYGLVARDLVRRLARVGTGYAVVYVSPAYVERLGLGWREVIAAVEPVFARAERRGVAVRVLLDSVRHWGPETAHRVLDVHRANPWPRVLGFGLGGDEASVPAQAFQEVYQRVRSMGLAPLIHAGEWAGAASVAEAVRFLRPVRIAHGVRAAEDPALVRLLARRGIPLDVCLASNRATRAVPADHPALRLIRAGVPVNHSTDDPGLFGTTLRGEYLRFARLGATERELRRVARFSRLHALSTFS